VVGTIDATPTLMVTNPTGDADRHIGHVLGLPFIKHPQLLGAVVERAVIRVALPTSQVSEEHPVRHIAGEKFAMPSKSKSSARGEEDKGSPAAEIGASQHGHAVLRE